MTSVSVAILKRNHALCSAVLQRHVCCMKYFMQRWANLTRPWQHTLLSPIGRNSLFCCRRFGLRLSAIAHINKSFVWAHYQAQLSVSYCRTVYLLLELLFVKFGYLSVSCLSQADITYAIDCTSWCVMCEIHFSSVQWFLERPKWYTSLQGPL